MDTGPVPWLAGQLQDFVRARTLKTAGLCVVVDPDQVTSFAVAKKLAGMKELHRWLARSLPGKVHSLVRAKPEQNWSQRQPYVDPEWPDKFESLCDRMNVPAPVSTSSPVAPAFQ
ncbi:hypothetical protein [Steroidobacter cummioxidans]|uniref:hypothetical protein n=1 Tax=Steroidobacter cummioxidans TaxID=1803913 RepID=UPI00128FF0FA|nr:hypothetical protein [Steroidobacter cummioxidans]